MNEYYGNRYLCYSILIVVYENLARICYLQAFIYG